MIRTIVMGVAGIALLALASEARSASPADNAAARKSESSKAPGPAPAPVMLPPFQVDAGQRWFYARGPRIEVLSQCSKAETARFMSEYARMSGFLDEILPPRFQARSDLPTGFVLFTDDVHHTTAWTHLVSSLSERQSAEARQHGISDRTIRKVEALPNFRLADLDSESVFVVLGEGDLPSSLKATPDYVRSLLETRTPPLPPWFVVGMRRLLARFTTKLGAVHGQGEFGPVNAGSGFGGLTLHDASGGAKGGNPRIGRQVWMNPAVFARLAEAYTAGDRGAFDEILRSTHTRPVPLAELFTRGHRDPGTPVDEARRRETAVLFLRLMMIDWKPQVAEWKRLELASYGVSTHASKTENGGVTIDSAVVPFYVDRIRPKLALDDRSRSSLWRFVERASAEPVTEALFRDCFGMSFSQGDAALHDALYFMFNNSIGVNEAALPKMRIRDATAAEVSRIKGDFNRLEIRYVRENAPEVTAEFVEQARRTLWKSYDTGDRDPRLLAELGLFECDVQDDAKAVPFLEAAVSAQVVRPRAYYELAWIRFAALRREHESAKLTREQLATVLDPLQAAKQQAPSLPAIYDLEAEAWRFSDVAPTAGQLAELRTNVRLFPDELRLVEAVALVHAAHGQLQTAQDLVTQEIQAVSVSAEREELTRFREALTLAQAQ